MLVQIEQSWKEVLQEEFSKEYFIALMAFVQDEYMRAAVYPLPENIFAAFAAVPFTKVRVVIVGQDPYHGANQANGLCFAVTNGVPHPPSLKNILKEIEADTGSASVGDSSLAHLASQGVLLLNSVLTVRAGSPASHQHKGWELFTDAVIASLSSKRSNLVFLLWGNYAKEKGAHIDRTKHLVLEAAHPSPFSAHQGFFDSKHFTSTNEYLRSIGEKPIAW